MLEHVIPPKIYRTADERESLLLIVSILRIWIIVIVMDLRRAPKGKNKKNR